MRLWPLTGLGQPDPEITVARSVSEVLSEHVQFEIESIDRMYLNLYIPQLQRAEGCAHFFRYHRGQPLPSSALMAPMTKSFVRNIENFAKREGIDLILFKKGQNKEEVAQGYRARCRPVRYGPVPRTRPW